MSPTIRLFTVNDVAPALDLCRSAGWNQLRGDWTRLIEYQPDGCFVAEIDGKQVGTVTTTSYSAELAWIGMMLVHPDYRRQGIATALMNASLEYLNATNVRCIKLDATSDGRPLYEQLGFRGEWSFHRWQLEFPSQRKPLEISGETDFGRLAALDLEAFGVDRNDWLRRLQVGSLIHSRADGFGMLRCGHLASYLGPVTAANPNSADEIIRGLLSRATGKVFWDVFQPNRDAVNLARQLGFAPIRDLTRMRIGDVPAINVGLQYAICDPGTG